MSADSAVHDSNGTGSTKSIEQVRALCLEALEICDALNLAPEIGAKLQEVLTALEENSKARSA